MFRVIMGSQTSLPNLNSSCFSHLGFHTTPRNRYFPPATRISCGSSPCRLRFEFSHASQLNASSVQKCGSTPHRSITQFNAMDEESAGTSALGDCDNEWNTGHMLSLSDGEDSDGDVLVNPLSDVDLPGINDQSPPPDEALRVTFHRLAMVGMSRKKNRSRYGVLNNLGLITFLITVFLLVDWCAWRIVRLPLPAFYLTRPFLISATVASCAGYIFVPLFDSLKIHKIQRAKGPFGCYSRRRTPTMGGLFFIPVSVIVAEMMVGFSSTELSAAALATLAFAVIGLLDDTIAITKKCNFGLSQMMKFLLEVAVATCFSFWLDAANISSPYGMKMLIPLPAPLGLVRPGKHYLFLTLFSFVFMGNGVNLTTGLDGLAAGTAALAFTGMAIAVLPISPDLSIFGVSFVGSCVGFLHNQQKTSVFMGNTGALALGGALAAMAACTGMFLPLFISSGFLVMEVLSVIIQVSYFKASGRRLMRAVPFHRHLEMCGIKGPAIVAAAYAVSSILAMAAGHLGLVSA